MKKSVIAMVAILTGLLALMTVGTVSAQEPTTEIGYYLAPDADGIQQIYQILLDGSQEARQITHAASDVITFEAAYDGLGVAYITDGQLWLQSIHVEEAEAVASISDMRYFSKPVWSQDGHYVAYGDSGVWLLELSTRETKQILANVQLDADASNMGEFRVFRPERFVLDADGKAAQLIVAVGVWEWATSGVYDLATGSLQELEGQVHTSLLPLTDGRALIYGNNGLGGEQALYIADSLNDINNYREIAKFSDLTNETLFAEQATEIAPGVVRVFGSTIAGLPETVNAFYFDVDTTAGTASEVMFITFSQGSNGNTVVGQLSPDGNFVPAHLNALWSDVGSISGNLKVFDLATGEATALPFPESAGLVRWQP